MKIITLTTDFGNSFFVGIMKGVILNICNDAKIVDITHQIKKFDVYEARFTIENSYNYFPQKTVHIVVVDPGVGSKRKNLIVETNDYFFVGPDNGVFSFLDCKKIKVYEITYKPKEISYTFHGRDIYAPVGAFLVKGERPHNLGQEITLLDLSTKFETNLNEFKIIYIDEFGNLFLNIKYKEFLSKTKNKNWEICYKNLKFNKIYDTYSEVPKGNPLLIINSFGYLEISFREKNAASLLGAKVGDRFSFKIY